MNNRRTSLRIPQGVNEISEPVIEYSESGNGFSESVIEYPGSVSVFSASVNAQNEGKNDFSPG